MKLLIAFFSFALVLSSCKTKTDNKPEAEAKAETVAESENWIYLFDGVTTNGWRAYNGESLPPGWVVKDSVLTFDTELGLEQDYTGERILSMVWKSLIILSSMWNGNCRKEAIVAFFIT